MKILQINVEWDNGGPGTVACDISQVAKSYNNQCIVAYSRGAKPIDFSSYKIGNKLDLVLHLISSRIFDNEGLMSKNETLKLIKYIDKIKPDVVHLHNLLGHYLNYPLLFEYLKGKKIPTVWTLHDCWAFTGHCINFERINCQKWKKVCENCLLKEEYPYSKIFDNSKRNFELKKRLYSNMENLYLVVPSLWLKNKVENSILKERNIKLIYNGLDLSLFKPTPSDYRKKYNLEGKKILLFVSFIWNTMKGYEIIKKLSEILDSKYAIVIIGNQKEEIKNYRTINIPATSNKEELIKWYSVADVFVNPTLGDNFPTVNIEALACGTPIVTCNTGGSPEIAGNEFGRVVYSKTPKEFVEKIEECINQAYDPSMCAQFAQKFDRKVAYNDYIKLYEEIIKNKRSK